MEVRVKRRLFALAVTVLVGYGIGWNAHAFGWTPILLLALVAVVSWLAGFSHAAMPLHRQVFEANRERDEIAARLVELETGAVVSVLHHPAVRTKIYGVKNWPAR